MASPIIATYTPDKLLAGDAVKALTRAITVLTGVAVNLVRGTVMGKITLGTIPTTGTAGSNTGTGAMTAVAAKRRTLVGTYTMTCVQAIANSGVFKVVNPLGKIIGYANVGVAFVSDEIGFSIADATDFIVGDSFTVVIPAGSGKYAIVDKAAINGAGVAVGVLSQDADARTADVETILYTQGIFNAAGLVYGSTDVRADHEADLRLTDIHIRTVIAADGII